ncbi:hypothetical protein NLJ89_g2940 [Agrocybe chaxingu]|uniref:Thiamine pyrophosphate enzyme N-terminal TPP-binding domain-containing protein n=1 Tax=Agrocybe chaxingu TaxID=84603 RepID=A0A9W8KBR2_9AGAR|nr:hypothetical protein NLJ89_g2940 [Agrocybe chaxingu]
MTTPQKIYTTSSLFLRSLSQSGITHAFVNWGSDHPALLEDLERQQTEHRTSRGEENGGTAEGETAPKIVTCPNEMVALSAAQGFAQATGKPAAVIVHVDVGTQALAGAIHNVDRGRTPVLIYAGASPFSAEREHKGSRNEWIMWIQGKCHVPDQSAIVRQYMRHTTQIGSAKTVEKTVKRALQIATSDPKGPVYLWARREVMEAEVDLTSVDSVSDMKGWPSLQPSALSSEGNVPNLPDQHMLTSRTALVTITTALLGAASPLIITSHLGRNPASVEPLLSLAALLSIPVVNSCPSVVNVPFSHPSFAGVTFLAPGTHSSILKGADVILVLDSDLPWVPANEVPNSDSQVFVIDSGDPLKLNIGYWHVDAELICRADPGVALRQILNELNVMGVRLGEKWEVTTHPEGLERIGIANIEAAVNARGEQLEKDHEAMVAVLNKAEETYPPASTPSLTSSSFTVPNLMSVLRRAINQLTPSRGEKVLFLNESISNFPATWMHLRPEYPGNMISSGGSSLGWALAAAVGAGLGSKTLGAGGTGAGPYDLIVAVVGDGSFMFGPFLTVILNNGGWHSPKLSMLGVHPAGHGSTAPGAQLTVGFGPDSPDHSQIAVAASAGWAWGTRIGGPGWTSERESDVDNTRQGSVEEGLEEVLAKAVNIVIQEKRCAVLDCVLDSI